MRYRTLALAAITICTLLPGGPARADEQQDRVLEHLSEGLKLRIEARMKRAGLLADLGRKEEALAVYESVEGLYEAGLEELRALVAGARGGGKGEPLVRLGPPDQVPAPDSSLERERRRRRVTPTPGTTGPLQDPPSDWSARRQRAALKRSVDDGLRWLATHQRADGAWDARAFSQWVDRKPFSGARIGGDAGYPLYTPGVTALAVLSFLVAGHTHKTGPHKRTVADGLKYLRSIQDPEGCVGPRTTPNFTYNHAVGTLALVQAYAQTQDARLKTSAQKALDFNAFTRNPHFGWRYGVKPGDTDTSSTHWMLLGLHTARALNRDAVAAGKSAPFVVDERAFEGALAWADKITDTDFGRGGYVVRGSGPARPSDLIDAFPGERSESMTAAAMNIRLMAGQDYKTSALLQKGAGLLGRLPPMWKPEQGNTDTCYWYLGTLVLYQIGGKHWRNWADNLIDATLPRQISSGKPARLQGSWDPLGPWAPDGGRVYSTALHIQMLVVLRQGLEDRDN